MASIEKNNPPGSGDNDVGLYFKRLCAMYVKRAKGVKKLSKSFDKLLESYRWTKKQPKWQGHLKKADGGSIVFKSARPSRGCDATKMGRKVEDAAAKIKASVTKKEKEMENVRTAWMEQIFDHIKKSYTLQLMANSSGKKRDQFFETAAETALIEAETAKKRALLESMKVNGEFGKFGGVAEDGDHGLDVHDDGKMDVDTEVDGVGVVEVVEGGIDNNLNGSSHSSSWGDEDNYYSPAEIRLRSISLIQVHSLFCTLFCISHWDMIPTSSSLYFITHNRYLMIPRWKDLMLDLLLSV